MPDPMFYPGQQDYIDKLNMLAEASAAGENSTITGLLNIDHIDFDTTATNPNQVGRLVWNDTDGTLNLGLKGGNVVLQVGQESVLPVRNNTGATLLNGSAVYITGSTGSSLTVAYSTNATEVGSTQTVGVLTEDIANNATGFVTTFGLVRDINTSALTEGAPVYLSTGGALTSTPPVAPAYKVLIGFCARSHVSQGAIFVHVSPDFRMLSSANTWTQPQTVDVNSASAALTVKQAGAGASLVVTGTGGAEVARVAPGGTVTLGGTVTAPAFAVAAAASSVNYWRATGGAAGNAEAPIFDVTGADTNIYANLTLKGAAEFRFKTNAGTAEQLRISHIANAVNYFSLRGGATAAAPTVVAQGTDTNITNVYQTKGAGQHTFATGGGALQLNIAHVASAVNYHHFYGNSTTNPVGHQAAGSDTNINSQIVSKGTGWIGFYTGGGAQGYFGNTASAVNYHWITGSAAGVGIGFMANGSDANINHGITSKGTAGVSISTASWTVPSAYFGYVASGVNYWGFNGAPASGFSVQQGAEGSSADIQVMHYTKGTYGHVFRTNGSAGSTQFFIQHIASAVNYWQAAGGDGTTNSPILYAVGSSTNVTGQLLSKGTGELQFITNSGASKQFAIGSNASVVNNPKIVGGAAGVSAIYLMEGADVNIGADYRTKGSYGHVFTTGSSYTIQLSVSHTASAVNYWQATGSATTISPVLSVLGSDVNVGPWIASKGNAGIAFATGSGGLQFLVAHYASAVNYVSVNGSATTVWPAIAVAGTDAAIGFEHRAKGAQSHSFTTGGGTQLVVAHNTSTDYLQVSGGAGSSFLYGNGATASVNNIYGVKSNGYHRFDTNGTGGNTQFLIAHIGSAVNYLQTKGSATAANPELSSQGSDLNINLAHISKGTGSHLFATGGGTQFVVASTASATNYLQTVGSATAISPVFSAQGADANVGPWFTSKGGANLAFASASGGLQFVVAHTASAVNYLAATGSATGARTSLSVQGSDADAENWYASKGAGGHAFASSGGKQFVIAHTASAVNNLQATGGAAGISPATSAQGTDVTIGTILQSKGDGGHRFTTTGSQLNQFTVSSTASSVNWLNATGAATTAWPSFSVQGSDTNVGAGLWAKGTSSLVFGGNGATQFMVASSASTVNYVQAKGSATGVNVDLSAQGSDTDISVQFSSKGAGGHRFNTTGGLQALITNTASATSYWTLTGGAALGSFAVQGVDANAVANYSSKGTGGHLFFTEGGTQFRISNVSSAVNFPYVRGAPTGSAVALGVLGTDANVDLWLLPKGTGNVQFGTWTSNADAAVNGYITIKDASGTVRKLATIA